MKLFKKLKNNTSFSVYQDKRYISFLPTILWSKIDHHPDAQRHNLKSVVEIGWLHFHVLIPICNKRGDNERR